MESCAAGDRHSAVLFSNRKAGEGLDGWLRGWMGGWVRGWMGEGFASE